MIYVLKPSLANNLQLRLLGILTFALLTGLGAQISIPRDPVPVTFQVLVVLLAGLTLGWRDGFASQATYLALIAIGLPLAADGIGGLTAFSRPSTGYLYSFPFAAALVGLLAVKDNYVMRWISCFSGIALIYLIGTVYLKFYFDIERDGMSWRAALSAGVLPFLVIDLGKALLALGSGEALREWWRTYMPPTR